MVFSCQLNLRAENLPDTETFGKIDPYYQVWFKDEKLYQSECVKNADQIVEWQPANFDIPGMAFMRELNVKIYDRDTFSSDDLIVDCQIRYPFRMKTYELGDTGARLAVLNDNGDSADEATDGSLEGDNDIIKKAAGFFALVKLGKMFS